MSQRTGGAVVGIVMGSDSDWPVMRAAAEALDEFAVPYEADVVSAHRMPRDMIEYGSSAEGRGLRVIIAGAGGAAHLPGMLASVTPLPVIGVPVPLANLSGLDSLLSIVQMPAGIPVATVAVGGARNAGLLAVRILAAAEDPAAAALRARVVSFAEQLADQARAKGAALRDRRQSGLPCPNPVDAAAGRFGHLPGPSVYQITVRGPSAGPNGISAFVLEDGDAGFSFGAPSTSSASRARRPESCTSTGQTPPELTLADGLLHRSLTSSPGERMRYHSSAGRLGHWRINGRPAALQGSRADHNGTDLHPGRRRA